MFSFTRTVVDLIQSATGLKVKPNAMNVKANKNHSNMDSSAQQRKGKFDECVLFSAHTPIKRTPHTSIGHALNTFKNSIVAAQDLNTGSISTSLIEEDFVYALQGYCATYYQYFLSI